MDIREIATQAAEESVTLHTVGIVGEEPGRGPRTGIGTGSAIEWRGRKIILTAAHVVNTHDPSQLRFLFRPEGTIEREDVENRSSQTRFLEAVEIKVHSIRPLHPLDLAIIDIPQDLDAIHPVTFFTLDATATTPVVGTAIMIIGFPAALGQRVYGGHFAASRAIAYERIADPAVMSQIDANIEFALNYTYGERVGPESIHPRGFSGAGIWSYRETNSLVWRASHAFGGMLTTYYPRTRVATGLRAEVIARALEQALSG